MYLMAAAMLAMAIASYPYNRIVFLIEITAAGLCALGVTVSGVLYRTNAVTTLRAAARVLAAEDQEVLEKFALPVAVVWVNEAFAESLGKGGPCLGEGISRYIYPKTFRQVMEARGTAVAYGGREYTVYGAKARHGYILYFVDDTYFKAVNKEYRDKWPGTTRGARNRASPPRWRPCSEAGP